MIIKAIVPFCFVAIWALTALFNKESSKGLPASAARPLPLEFGPRPGDPSRSLGPSRASSSQSTVTRRVPIGDDDILIIPNDPSRPAQDHIGPDTPDRVSAHDDRPRGDKRPRLPRKSSQPVGRPKLAGVSQSVNQSTRQARGS